MEDRYGRNSSGIVGQHSGIWISLRNEDLEEEEVWEVLQNTEHYGISKSKVNLTSSSSPIAVRGLLPTAARMIPKMAASSSDNSSTNSSHENQVVLPQSAPVAIPDWSRIYNRTNKTNKTHHKNVSRFDDNEEEEKEEDDDDNVYDENGDEIDLKLPPHELISRRLARSQISSFSVFEGVGRTLKGRDLSKVRNAVLTKTGFLESL